MEKENTQKNGKNRVLFLQSTGTVPRVFFEAVDAFLPELQNTLAKYSNNRKETSMQSGPHVPHWTRFPLQCLFLGRLVFLAVALPNCNALQKGRDLDKSWAFCSHLTIVLNWTLAAPVFISQKPIWMASWQELLNGLVLDSLAYSMCNLTERVHEKKKGTKSQTPVQLNISLVSGMAGLNVKEQNLTQVQSRKSANTSGTSHLKSIQAKGD